ncbi:MAG: immune inhibitor A, partial [Candidatus Krumholzibacteria bacterium]|nr:immune inhibitor A [Candidatus Krumholzibacteria bacterium]
EADYWNLSSQGSEILNYLDLYDKVILDERSSISTSEKTAYSDFLTSAGPGAKKGFFIMGRDLGYYSSTRPWIAEWMRADYVQDNPAWYELTGEPGEPIGAEETFVISGSYPDEVERSETYPGGEIVYRYTGPGSAALSREEIQGAYDKAEKEWDGVMPHAPKSLDAAAGIKYNGDTYRSVYFTFNFDYIPEPSRQAGIADRVIRWLDAPEIVHAPLGDSEDTLSVYTVTALVYSADLDPSRVNLTYDVGGGDVQVLMTPTGNPDEYAADIPPQTFGTTVSYYISAANNDGNTTFHPSGAPTDRHTFQVNADLVPPEIVHEPVQYFADLTGPYTISATVTDNVGVDPSGVSLTYSKNGGGTTTTAMANVGGDVYEGDIPGPSVVGDLYDYYILARDIAAVPNIAREPHTGTHQFEIVDFFAWDFEADDGGFAGTGDWEWGAPTSGPGAAHSGDNVWATSVSGDYSSSSNSKLETPALIVPGSGAYAQLTYWQWYYIETNYDGGNVKISTDGGSSWTILTPDIGYNGTATSGNAGIPGEACFTGYNNDEWHKVTMDLTAYRGQSVMIRWHFGSDSSVQRTGWYIDDV